MAGRPVTVHGGQSGLFYGLITFAILSALLLGFSIFMLTRVKDAESRADAATRQREQLVGPSGSVPGYYADEATNRKTSVVGAMSQDLQSLASLTTGVPDDTAVAVQTRIDRTMGEFATRHPQVLNRGDALLTALTKLSDALTQSQTTLRETTLRSEDTQAQLAACTDQLKATRDQFEAQVEDLAGQVRRAQDERMQALTAKDNQMRDLQSSLDACQQQNQQMRQLGTRQVQDLRIELSQRDRQIDDLQKQITALKPQSFDPAKILTAADGRIVRAIPGSDVVYVNLGAADRIRPGMGFEVYSQTGETPAGMRGKASLEVVTAMEETAECRVTRRTPGQPILEGDVIVNIAYARNRQPKFVVRGDFDLNYDGVMDFNGIEQITSLVRQWGGQVVDELDESVDFVVIGVAPSGPAFDEKTAVSDVVREQAQQRDLERSQFRALVERAQKMFIPVITQNQFLFLTGFSGEARLARR